MLLDACFMLGLLGVSFFHSFKKNKKKTIKFGILQQGI